MRRALIDQTDPLLKRFLEQRSQAQQRGIQWDLSYLEWLASWRASGHLHQRGRRKGMYQMCRENDRGCYCSSNVRIDKMEVNASEGQITKRRLRLARQEFASAANDPRTGLTSPST